MTLTPFGDRLPLSYLAILEVCAGRPGDVEVFAQSSGERGVFHLQQIGVRAVLVAAVNDKRCVISGTDYRTFIEAGDFA